MCTRFVRRVVVATTAAVLAGVLVTTPQPLLAQEAEPHLAVRAQAFQAQGDPMPELLRSFNLTDTASFRAMLANAAGRLATVNTAAGEEPNTVDAVLAEAAVDRAVYVKLAPHMLAIAFEAISTRTPTPSQQDFYDEFQTYYAERIQFNALRMLQAWNQHRGTNIFPENLVLGEGYYPVLFDPGGPDLGLPQPINQSTTPLSILIDTGPGLNTFEPPADLWPMSEAGGEAIIEILGPMAILEIDPNSPDPLAVGGDVTTAALAGLGLGAGAGVVSVGSAIGVIGLSNAAANAMLAAKSAAYVARGLPPLIFKAVPLLGVGVGAGTVISAVIVVIPMLISLGMSIANVIQTQQFESALLSTASAPNYDVDIRDLVDPTFVQDAGLWYRKCQDGHRGVATRCYRDCDPGYTDDGLFCRRDVDSFSKDSYQRGAQILGCRAGLVNDAGLCYTPCPPGTRGVATRCYANCPLERRGNTRLLPRQIYRDDGLFCGKGLDIGRGAGYVIWEQATCERNHGVGNCELQGLLWYPRCPAGYRQTTVNFCTQLCPAGWTDIGVSCAKPWTDRGIGVPIDSCPAGTERLGALCYPLCRDGFTNPPFLVHTCLTTAPCPEGYVDTGLTCLRNTHIYAKSFYDRGVGTINPPSDADREATRKAMFNYVVRMMIADPAGGAGPVPGGGTPGNTPTVPDGVGTFTIVRPRSAVDGGPAVCPEGTELLGELCGPALTEAANLVINRVTDEGVAPPLPAVAWDASESTAIAGGELEFSWDFGDGTTATGPVAEHTYTEAGTYNMVVTATDQAGRTSESQIAVDVVAAGPNGLEVTAEAGRTGQPTVLQGEFATTTGPSRHVIEIDWGDGSTDDIALSSGERTIDATHIYSEAGEKTIVVTVTDEQALSTTGEAVVTVEASGPAVGQLVGIVGFGESEGAYPVIAISSISDQLGATDGSIEIDWGDGVVDALADETFGRLFVARHVYETAGEQTITVTAIAADGTRGEPKAVTLTIEAAEEPDPEPGDLGSIDGFVFDDANGNGELDEMGNVSQILDGSGDGEAVLREPTGVATDPDGNVFVAGNTSNNVLRVSPAGEISQLINVDDGLFSPYAVEADDAGNVFVAGLGESNVLRVDGDASGDGEVSTLIDATGDGMGNPLIAPFGLASDEDGNVFVSGGNSDNVFRVTPDGAIDELASGGELGSSVLYRARGVASDLDGNVFVAGHFSDTVVRMTPEGEVDTLGTSAGDGDGNVLNGPFAVATDLDGNVFVTGVFSNNAFRITPEGDVTEIIDEAGDGTNSLVLPHGIATDFEGNVYVSGQNSDNVFRITPDGRITMVIGPDGDGTNALDGPLHVTVDDDDNVYVVGSASDNVFRIGGERGVAATSLVLSGDELEGPITVESDLDGAFEFSDLLPGTYTLTQTITVDGESTAGATAEITVVAGEATEVDFAV